MTSTKSSPFDPAQIFGVTLDKMLTYHLTPRATLQNMTLCVTLLRQFAVNSSFNNSTHLIHPVISDALWTVTRCLHPTPTGNLPNLVSIQPAELCHERISLSLAQRTMESGHLLHSVLTCPSSGNARHLKSRHPIVPSAQQLISLSVDNSRRVALWVDPRWNVEWLENTTRLCTFIPDIGTHTPGMALLRTACVQPNCLYNNVRFSAPACTNGVWPPFWAYVEQTRPLTMLPYNVQSIDSPAWPEGS